MFEELLEDIAQKNGLREVNPYIKLTAGLGAILLCLLSTGYFPPLFIALVLTGAILFLARVEAKMYAGLFIVPLWFALMSVAGIILISGGQDIFWRWDILSSFSLSVTRESINQGVFVFCRVLGGMSAHVLYFPHNSHDRYFYGITAVQGSRDHHRPDDDHLPHNFYPDGPGCPGVQCTGDAPWLFNVAGIREFFSSSAVLLSFQLGFRGGFNPGHGCPML